MVTWWLQVVMVVTLFDSKGLSGAATETKELVEWLYIDTRVTGY